MRVTHHWLMTAEPQKLRTKCVLSFSNYTFYLESSKNQCQKFHSASISYPNCLLYSKMPGRPASHKLKRPHALRTAKCQEGRQAIHPRDPSRQSSHHRCLPQSKMPKEAHKPPNTPGVLSLCCFMFMMIEQSHVLDVEHHNIAPPSVDLWLIRRARYVPQKGTSMIVTVI